MNIRATSSEKTGSGPEALIFSPVLRRGSGNAQPGPQTRSQYLTNRTRWGGMSAAVGCPSGLARCSRKHPLLADLVGDRKQRRRDIDAAYFGGPAKFSRAGEEEASRPSQSPEPGFGEKYWSLKLLEIGRCGSRLVRARTPMAFAFASSPAPSPTPAALIAPRHRLSPRLRPRRFEPLIREASSCYNAACERTRAIVRASTSDTR